MNLANVVQSRPQIKAFFLVCHIVCCRASLVIFSRQVPDDIVKLSTLLGLAPNGCHIVCFETCVLFLPGQVLDAVGDIVGFMDVVIFMARSFSSQISDQFCSNVAQTSFMV